MPLEQEEFQIPVRIPFFYSSVSYATNSTVNGLLLIFL